MWMGTYYRDQLLKELKFDLTGKNALEIGCHDGFLLSNLSAEKKVGIDPEPIRKYLGINYIEGDFLSYDFKGKKFDSILSIEVLEHVKDPKKFMQNLDPLIGGKVLMSVPSKNIKIFPYIFQSYLDKKWGHEYRRGYNIKELHQLLEHVNKDYKILSWNCPFWRTFYLPMKMLWKVTPGLTKKLLKVSIKLDKKFKKGKKGFFFIYVG